MVNPPLMPFGDTSGAGSTPDQPVTAATKQALPKYEARLRLLEARPGAPEVYEPCPRLLETGGKKLCAHGRARSNCKEHCGGICPHGRARSNCKECGGKGICEHGRRKDNCKECGGSSICPHGRYRHQCKECGGRSICPHGRRRPDCKDCGGSQVCAHERARSTCRECNPNITKLAHNCNSCGTCLDSKRRESNGGVGLCAKCEHNLKAEAHANGSAPPPKGKSWETLCFDELLPLVAYADGTPFPPDQRDQRAGGGLGTSKVVKRRRECDTVTNRFPDCLWVRRDAESRAVLVVIAECDEHSHGPREPTCESGKIDETFQAVQSVLASEGAGRVARAGRPDAQMVPIVFLKFNPNACDVARVKRADRVVAVAALINSYLQKTEAEVAALHTRGPIVHILFYHSKDGAENIAHFDAKAADAGWEYHGNAVATM